MAASAIGPLSWPVALRLGRVSNLPTVRVNVLTGAALSEVALRYELLLPALMAVSLLYIAGMFLNDYFDRDFDRRYRPERPIPAGDVDPSVVFGAALVMVAGALILLALAGILAGGSHGWAPVLAGGTLALLIFAYDIWHKDNALGPLLMGSCRALVYVIAALALVGEVPTKVIVVGIASVCYVGGLTYAAKSENPRATGGSWPLMMLAVPAAVGLTFAGSSILSSGALMIFASWVMRALACHLSAKRRNTPRAVASMIAGMSLMDAVFISQTGRVDLCALALVGFLLTLRMQRHVSGT